MKSDAALASVLEPLYESVLEPERLQVLNQRLAQATGSNITAVLVHDVANGNGDVSLVHGLDAQWMAEQLANHDLLADPLVQRVVPRLCTGRVLNSDDLMPRAQMQRTAAFNDYYRRLDIGQQVAAVAHYDGTSSVTLSMCREVRSPAFDDTAMTLLRNLAPHWVNAYAIQRRLSWLQQRVDTLENALDAVPHAMFLLDLGQRVLRMNAAAERLLSAGDVLGLEEGRPRALQDARALRQLLFAACQGTAQDSEVVRRQGTITLRDASGRNALVATAHPLSTAALRQGIGETAILFLQPVGSGLARDLKTLLRQLFGLTLAEATLADALYRQADLALAAAQTGVSLATAQTRLKLVYDKTGERGQPALMRLLTTLASATA